MTQPGITDERIAEIAHKYTNSRKCDLGVPDAIKQALKEEREAIADWIEKKAECDAYESRDTHEWIAIQLRELQE